ncbi:MAG: tRNA (N6-isopentenyl adenosine(37)-C2)-methylthiotransferase MiaB [Lachnospiraceae bacterium]|nr:tRNA (N6-isopentenyl adenosine(37)-C2)-methylthiotransferase MiaB [Lachnospiraceae bacterium]
MKNIEKTYKIITFGCQMNARDSEKLAGVLEKKGYTEGIDEETSDIVIFNTCTVRENANKRLYGRVGHLKKSCAENRDKIVGICGCMMQETDEVETIKKKYPHVKLIFGTHNIDEFEKLIDKVLKDNERTIEVLDKADGIEKDMPSKRVYPFKCGVNIMYGCDNFCTYCIVPYVRGRERSRTAKSIIDEIKRDVDDGVVEVMLLGQNVNSYKGKLDDDSDKVLTFPELLSMVCNVDGLKRVRFMTSHPKDLSDELIDVIRDNNNCCKHIHLPVQSGSDRILESMNRHYTKEKYLSIVDKIRRELPDVAITTDVIVGFPGETEDDFNETIDLIEKVNFDSVFTFEYSKRTGTKAASMDNQVDAVIVKKRFDRLLKTVEKNSRYNSEKYVGRVMDVLVESKDRDMGKLTGRLSNNYLVHFEGDESLIGSIIDVKLMKACGFYFEGEKC